MAKLTMPPLNDLYMKWDIKGGYWYSPNGTQITPRDMMEYAIQLEDENKRMKEGLRNEGKRIVEALEDYAKDLDKLGGK